eukprot:2035802-Alexandrium_andersonii.AAC.1
MVWHRKRVHGWILATQGQRCDSQKGLFGGGLHGQYLNAKEAPTGRFGGVSCLPRESEGTCKEVQPSGNAEDRASFGT